VTADVAERLTRVAAEIGSAMVPYLSDPGGGSQLDDLLADYPSRGGKGLRPALLLATCEAHGGTVEDARSCAVAIELLHNAFLVHDDIEDGSRLRRGRPTLHRRVGLGPALNTGDALAVVALRPLHDDELLSSEVRRRLLDDWFRMAGATFSGQALELAWRDDPDVVLAEPDYLELILRKTCWYTTMFPLRAGAIIATRGTAPLDRLTRFGFLLGAAFQIRDDLLDLLAEPGEHGKDPLGDLWEGKRTLMLVHLVRHAEPGDRAALDDYLRRTRAERDEAIVSEVRSMMDRSGSLAYAQEFGRGIAAAAGDAFDDAFATVPDSPHRRFVADLVEFMLARTA
jgi:geranylgeranyl diphosphate synthase type II